MSNALRSALLAICVAVQANAPAAVDQPFPLTTPTGTIAGTLLLPQAVATLPVVLIIAGSGPTDRDGNAVGLGKNNCYKMLAEALAAETIASVRYDKRLIGASAQPGLNESDIRFRTYVDDASAWIQKLRADPRFSSVTVVGHSEGSLIGMIAAREERADAYVSISGVARGAAAVLRDQLRPQLLALPELWQSSETILASLEAGKTIDGVPAPLAALYRPSVQPYLISWFAFTPATEIAKLTIPALIVQGTTDIQVTVAEAQALHAALPSAKLTIVEGMNHVLKMVPADRSAQLASYTDPSLPIAPEVPKSIAAFVKSLRVP